MSDLALGRRTAERADPFRMRTVALMLAIGIIGFVGMLVMWMCQAGNWSPPMTAVTVGVSGWLGASASIQMLQRFIWGRLGLSRNLDDDHPT